MSQLLRPQVSPFFVGLMAGRPCYEQIVMAWVTHSYWQLGAAASILFLCQHAGTSQKRIVEALQVLINDGLVAKEQVTETREGYIPTVATIAAGVSEKAPDSKEVGDDGVVKDGMIVRDTKGKEEGKEAAGKKGAKPPSLSTIEAVVRVKGWKFDPRAFHAFYADRGWVTRDGVTVTTRNWYHMAKNWADRADRGGPGAASHEDATA